MSDALQVFLKKQSIPSIEALIKHLSGQGLELEKWDDEVETLNDIDGFWPGTLKGSDAGFEFGMEEVDNDDLDDWGVEPSQLEGRDMVMELSYHTENDLVASVLFIDFICRFCGGITFDENDELTVTESNSERWKKEMLGDLL